MIGVEDYVKRGWKVFPCHTIDRGRCTCGRGVECTSPGKHPRTKNGVKDATSDMATVASWLQRWPLVNWAVATGLASGFAVIDVDSGKSGFESLEQLEIERQGGPLPNTVRASTGGGGRHLYFAVGTESIPNRTEWLKGVDIRGDGGYVILPPGAHASGGSYNWINFEDDLADIPTDIVRSIKNSSAASSKDFLPTTDDILLGVPEGKRDDTLFRACCRWRRQLGDNRAAVETLALTAASKCEPPFPADQALKCVESAFKQDHVDGGPIMHPGEEGNGFQPLTDVGNAYRFIDAYGEDVIYVQGWGWLVWSETGWRRDGMGNVAGMSQSIGGLIWQERDALESMGADQKTIGRHQKWAHESQSAGRISAVTRLAQDIKDVRKPVEAFDSEDFLIACQNGMVDLRNGSLRPIDRDDLVTKNTGVFYDPEFVLPEWNNFLLESCEGDTEMVEYLQRAAGYTLTGSNQEEIFFLLSGPPASGKSTFLDGLHAMLGSYGTTTQSDTFMYRRGQQPPSNELARLAGMRLVSMSEIKEGESFSESMIKQFTGGDQVTARFLYQESFQYRPQFKLWIGTNNDPNVFDEALWRRTKKIPFYHSIPANRRDPQLKIKLRDPDLGGKAILAWAVEGAKKWLKKGLEEPSRIKMEIAAYKSEQDRPAQFIQDCLTESEGNTIGVNQLYQSYRFWCAAVNEPVKRQPQFIKMLTSRGVKVSRDDRGKVAFRDVAIKAEQLKDLQWG